MIPIFYWIETVNQQLLHAIYTVNLPVEDAARLKSRMGKKRRNSLIAMLCGLGLFFCGILLPFFTYLIFGEDVASGIFDSQDGVMIGLLITGFIGLFIGIFAANKYFGVAGVYLKALRIAYSNLPTQVSDNGSNEYITTNVYNPKDYQTNRKNKSLLEGLASGQVDEARARGLLHYAISGRSTSLFMIIFAFSFGLVLFILWALISIFSIQILDGSADHMLSIMIPGMWILMFLSGTMQIFHFRTNKTYIEAIESGYPSLRGHHAVPRP